MTTPGACELRPAQPDATVVHVMTVPNSLVFLSGQTRFMRERGFELRFITSSSPWLAPFEASEGVRVDQVDMLREISPLRDLRALLELWRTLRRIAPDVVHSHTPKAGLLGMLAGFLARTPVRVYHLRGLRLETETGARRFVLRAAERTACLFAHRVLAVSGSLRQNAIAEGLCRAEKIRVLANGSGNGVDTQRFAPADEQSRRAARARHGIPADAVVVGFLGRLTKDKGLRELVDAWRVLRENVPAARLLVVGEPDGTDPLPPATLEALARDPRVHLAPGIPFRDVDQMYPAMDVVALPTYREGFPNVALEAAAMGLPVVASAVTGCVDAVVPGETGALVPVRDGKALAAALEAYLVDPALRAAHGAAGRRRVLAEFQPQMIWEAIAEEYRSCLAARPVAVPAPSAGHSGGRRRARAAAPRSGA